MKDRNHVDWHNFRYLRCDGRNRLDGVEELHLLVVITDVLLNQQAVRLRVDVLHRHLESVESASLRYLVLVGDSQLFAEILYLARIDESNCALITNEEFLQNSEDLDLVGEVR